MVKKLTKNYFWIINILKIINVPKKVLSNCLFLKKKYWYFAVKNDNNLYYDFYTFPMS